ncbi:diaminopimelate decarboxylase [Flexivirga caeni]|uniref:Diaminopimelate decarboxylase n=1 Tax=Flexivirga caeni TaxID=2294115 RepID=A0A3M9M2T2_9MICO|nr:diaminopimelate decarboxylase [Flexivirga caeni]RNI19517.1 diaminopimelate decarboxylase [Flexivirga caeni]
MPVPLFPASAAWSDAGRLSVGGVDLHDLASEFGTPAYVFDVAEFRNRAAQLVDGLTARWPNSQVLFASKALPTVATYALAAHCGLGIDVSGQGEIVMALAAGVDPKLLYFHGNAKTTEELTFAVRSGVGTIVIDNADELDRLLAIPAPGQHVLIRVIPGVAPETHPSQSTGGSDSKFGVPYDQAHAMTEKIRSSEMVFDGVHLHIGSQILHAAPFGEAVRQLAEFPGCAVYDVGGGLGVPYTYAEQPPSIDAYLDAIVTAARDTLPADAKLIIEPGRSLVAIAGLTLYTVVSVKRTGRTFVAVDGGMADNLDPALTQQRYEAVIAQDRPDAPLVQCDLVGRQCESGDKLIGDLELAGPQIGDLVAMPVTGAYAYTLANNYNGARKAPVVFVEDGTTQLVVRRETYDDLLSTQLGWRP